MTRFANQIANDFQDGPGTPLSARLSPVATLQVYNLFNHQVLGSVNTTPTAGQFGEVTTDGWPNSSGRWLAVQGRLRF